MVIEVECTRLKEEAFAWHFLFKLLQAKLCWLTTTNKDYLMVQSDYYVKSRFTPKKMCLGFV